MDSELVGTIRHYSCFMLVITTIRSYADGAGRFVRSRPSLLGRLLLGAALIVAAIVAFLLLLPFMVLGLLFAACVVLWVRIRLALLRARQPNGVMDGRKNVRVRRGDEAETVETIGEGER